MPRETNLRYLRWILKGSARGSFAYKIVLQASIFSLFFRSVSLISCHAIFWQSSLSQFRFIMNLTRGCWFGLLNLKHKIAVKCSFMKSSWHILSFIALKYFCRSVWKKSSLALGCAKVGERKNCKSFARSNLRAAEKRKTLPTRSNAQKNQVYDLMLATQAVHSSQT